MGFLILDSFYLFTEFTLKFLKFTHKGTSLAVHWLGLHTSIIVVTSSIPGQGTKIPTCCAVWSKDYIYIYTHCKIHICIIYILRKIDEEREAVSEDRWGCSCKLLSLRKWCLSDNLKSVGEQTMEQIQRPEWKRALQGQG